MDKGKTALALIFGLLAATGIWLLKISTPSGLGLIDDAISYIAAARAMLSGLGFTRIWLATGLEPITHWPPGFSATLAAISFVLKIDPYRSARVLNMLVLGGNAALLALLGYKMTKSTLWATVLAVLFLTNSAILRLHAQALSEPLYIFISLLAFSAFFHALRQQEEPAGDKWLILVGVLTAFSYLIRYAAFSLLATFIVAIFILRPTWRKRFTSFSCFLLGALPPIFAWMLRNEIVSGTATNRALAWHPVRLENAQRGLREFFSFLVPLRELQTTWIENYSLLAILLFIFTVTLLIWLLREGLRYFFKPTEDSLPTIIPFTTALYIFGYMGALLVSLSFFDAATPLNDRILSPVYVAVLMMLVYFIHKLVEQGKILPNIFSSIFLFFFLLIFVVSQIQTVEVLQETPQGFASWRWRESSIMETLRNLPEDVEIHTNQPTATYFWTERPVYRLWDFQPESVRNGDAVVVIFFPPDEEAPAFQAWFAKMTDGLTLIEKSGLGNIYAK